MARFGLTLGVIGAAAVLAAGGGARAAGFDVIRTGPDGVTVINRDAVERIGDGGVRRAVSVAIKRNLVSGGPPQPGYVSTITDYDCAAWTVRWRSFSAYSRFGQLVLRKDNPEPAWTSINADIEAMAAARIVCDGKGAGSVYAAESIGQLVATLMQAWDAEAPLPPPQPVQPAPPRKAPPKPPRHRPHRAAP